MSNVNKLKLNTNLIIIKLVFNSSHTYTNIVVINTDITYSQILELDVIMS